MYNLQIIFQATLKIGMGFVASFVLVCICLAIYEINQKKTQGA